MVGAWSSGRICLRDLSDGFLHEFMLMADGLWLFGLNSVVEKNAGRTDGRTDPLIEMRGRI